jgi:hypothetical protein
LNIRRAIYKLAGGEVTVKQLKQIVKKEGRPASKLIVAQ